MDNTPLWKRAAKKITSQHTRECIKRAIFQGYFSIHNIHAKRVINKEFGVNLVGHIRGDFGLGESCRILANILQESEIPFSVYNVPQNSTASENDMTWMSFEQEDFPYAINLIHLNPNEIASVVWTLPYKQLSSCYNIAFWLWELPEFPKEWNYAFQLFDEIWTPAEFVSEAIQKCTSKPVFTIPYGFNEPITDVAYNRTFFALPEKTFFFLISYDGNSVSERKNPLGAIRAYCEAFSADERNVGIVIKATHAKGQDLEVINKYLSGYPNVYILTQSYDKIEFNSLVRCVDAYVSLHRAEGFGLVMAEAMLIGTPVIATAWSANLEYMDSNTACLVDADVVELADDIPPYHRGNHWAQPNEQQAAQWMRKLYDDQQFAKRIALNAKEYMGLHMTTKCAAQRMKERLGRLELTLENG